MFPRTYCEAYFGILLRFIAYSYISVTLTNVIPFQSSINYCKHINLSHVNFRINESSETTKF